jgi:hypothetical protein
VLLWFVGGSALIVWNVFRDPAIDYRVLAVGSLLPDIVDVASGHRVAHSVTVSVAVLVVLMLGTIGRRGLRKRLLMLPIGMLLHLALDGVFQSTRTFWWPITGLPPVAGRIPSLVRGPLYNIGFEVVGALVLRWFWKRFLLGQPEQRAAFLSTGRLPIP